MLFSLVILGTFLTSCIPTSTDFDSSWYDRDFHEGPVKHVMILALTDNSHRQMAAEDIFKETFEKRGVKAVASYKIMPTSIKVSKETIKAAIADHDIDAVFVVQFVGSEKAKEVVPGYTETRYGNRGRNGYYRYYDYRYGGGYDTQTYHRDTYTVEYNNVTIDNKLFKVAGESLIYQAQTKTVNAEKFDTVVKQIADKVSKDIAQKGLF